VGVRDALQVIADQWSDIEPLLTVAELRTLAGVNRETMRGVGSRRSEAVFGLVAQALPADHPAWLALRARTGPGPVRGSSQPDVDLIDLADLALASPLAEVDAAADALVEQSNAALLRFGAAPADPEVEDDELWLSVRVGDEEYYPLFQFASAEPYRQYELVARLRPKLGADEDPAGAAAWWLTVNPWLRAMPAELLGTDREGEIAYAADQLANDSW
jgi:hypothetical protein